MYLDNDDAFDGSGGREQISVSKNIRCSVIFQPRQRLSNAVVGPGFFGVSFQAM